MKMSKILMVFIIGIISLNVIFGGSIQKSFLIKGDFTDAPGAVSQCISGGQGDCKIFITDPNGIDITSSSIFSGTNSRSNVAEIKSNLRSGITTPVLNITSTDPTVNFIISIKKDHLNSYNTTLLTTTIAVPNPNASGIKISSDKLQPTTPSPVCDSTNVNAVQIHNGNLMKCSYDGGYSWVSITGSGGGFNASQFYSQHFFYGTIPGEQTGGNELVQIKQDSITSNIIKDGEIDFIDLHPDVMSWILDTETGISDNSSNIDYILDSAVFTDDEDSIKRLTAHSNKIKLLTTTEINQFNNLNPTTQFYNFVPVYVKNGSDYDSYWIKVYNPLVTYDINFGGADKSGDHKYYMLRKGVGGLGTPNYNLYLMADGTTTQQYTCIVKARIRTCNAGWYEGSFKKCGLSSYEDRYTTLELYNGPCNVGSLSLNNSVITNFENWAWGREESNQFSRSWWNTRGGTDLTVTLKVKSGNEIIQEISKEGKLYLTMYNPEFYIDAQNLYKLYLPIGFDSIPSTKVLNDGQNINVKNTQYKIGIKDFGSFERNTGSNNFTYDVKYKVILDGDNLTQRDCSQQSYTLDFIEPRIKNGEITTYNSTTNLNATVSNLQGRPVASMLKQLCIKMVVTDNVTQEERTIYKSYSILARSVS